MGDHYCCKTCHQRYDCCICQPIDVAIGGKYPKFKDINQQDLEAKITEKIIEAEKKLVAVKADSGKTNWSLLPIESVEEILKVLEFGATKYDDWNWSTGNGFSYTRVFNATMRHLWAWFRGEDNDPETGLSHWAHAGCNVLFMLHFIKNKERYNQDDRKFSRAK